MKNINVNQFAKSFFAFTTVKEGYKDIHEEKLNELIDLLPSGSGIDAGIKFDWDKSTKDKLIFNFGFHHMNETGYYDGWTEHQIIITPSLADKFNLKITGKDRNPQAIKACWFFV